MPQPKKNTPAEQTDSIVESLLDQAKELKDQREALLEKTTANRETLRNLRKTGLLSDEQAKEVDDYYPPITRKRKDGENGGDTATA